MIDFDVMNRLTGAVQFTARIECEPDAPRSKKLGLAVQWAIANGANLLDADLRGANLHGVNLREANLHGANLFGDNFRHFRDDFWGTLRQAHNEIPALIAALREGRVDGSQYEGECACLVGTIANARGVNYRTAFPNCGLSNPAEQWFRMIRKGDKAGDDSGGGFAAQMAVDWALGYCEANGVDSGEQPIDHKEQAQ